MIQPPNNKNVRKNVDETFKMEMPAWFRRWFYIWKIDLFCGLVLFVCVIWVIVIVEGSTPQCDPGYIPLYGKCVAGYDPKTR